MPKTRHQFGDDIKRRSKYSGMDASMIEQMNTLKEEHRRLKKTYAESQICADIQEEALSKNGKASSVPGDGPMGGSDQGREHPAGLLSRSTDAVERECGDCRLAGPATPQPVQLGLRPVFPAPAQRQGLLQEPQVRLAHRPGSGIELADQTQKASGAG